MLLLVLLVCICSFSTYFPLLRLCIVSKASRIEANLSTQLLRKSSFRKHDGNSNESI